MRVVLDTNIIISGLNFAGKERHVLNLAGARAYELYLSSFILTETSGVLIRKFGWDEVRARQAVEILASWATLVEPATRLSVIQRNQADNHILECAVEAAVDYLVTGDRRDLLPLKEFQGIQIVTSSEFMSFFTTEST